jgi:hypothetical protein
MSLMKYVGQHASVKNPTVLGKKRKYLESTMKNRKITNTLYMQHVKQIEGSLSFTHNLLYR